MGYVTLGCKVNQVDTEQIHDAVRTSLGAGASGGLPSGFVVVNSCAVTAEAVTKTRKALRRAARDETVHTVIVTGCAAAVAAEELAAINPKVVVVADRADVAATIVARLASMGDEPKRAAASGGHDAALPASRTRRSLKIQDGCEAFCSYCIVPYARGPERSTSSATIAERARALAAAGVGEVVLTGINIGRYRDPDSGQGLSALVAGLGATGLHRIRLSSIEPLDVTDELLGALANGHVGCEHLHIPLQSGSDQVLADMNRHYSVAQFEQVVALVRARWPHAAITTDLIVGYPTETDLAFAETLATLERINFAKVHVFRYSARSGTPAATLPALAPETIAQRAALVGALADDHARRYRESLEGRQVEAIVERVADGVAHLTTREHIGMSVPAGDLRVGDITSVSFHG